MATKIDTLNRELRNRIKAGQPNLWSHGNGLCFALAKNGTASWVIRYTVNAKRRVMTLEPHSDPITDRKLKELEAANTRTEADVAAPTTNRNKFNDSKVPQVQQARAGED
ncbi:hypothetical protein CK228_18195 [Mesorhizobium sp. WSM4312]|uniref:Arm DNA-binding domain-containing protein n=1 Tax=Mesorhizobium sp. WSM4312 TaxID=2029411 RepID=UPI000BAFF647|nr:Arm DNA-binding domain-containing protein [Mesorhizobium sp. WSM4312]PBB67120.1 hypothetical protein CK228_18195 [Mesorhizobium sp. WSM4312]